MGKRVVHPWKPWEVNLLRKLCKKGETSVDISEVLNRTVIAIQRKARELGLRTDRFRRNGINPIQRAKLLDIILENPGIYISELSRRLGRNQKTVRRMMRKLMSEGFVINSGGVSSDCYFEVTSKWGDNRNGALPK